MKEIKVKKYLDFKNKCRIAKEVLELCFNDIDYDPLARECAEVFIIAKYYSDVDIMLTNGQEDAVKTYDKLNRENIYYNNIYKKIPSHEIRKTEQLIQSLIDERLKRGTITYQLSKKLNNMDLDKLLSDLKTFDFNKFQEVKKVMEMNNSFVKKVK